MTPLLLLAACRPDLTPSYAFDPIWIAPEAGADEPGSIHGFQTWQVYGPDWPRRYADKHYTCSVVVELWGVPTACDADETCNFAWETAPEVRQTDCEPAQLAERELFLSLRKVALGGEAKGTAEGLAVPWPGVTSTGWADYGNGWEIHGYAYPEALDAGLEVKSGEWDEEQPFLLVPTQSFPL